MDDRPPSVEAALARLERGDATTHGAPTGGLERDSPRTAQSAVSEWLKHVGFRPGAFMSPTSTAMAKQLEAHARARGWVYDYVHPTRLGQLLVKMGYVRGKTGHDVGYRVDRDTHRKLWASTPRILRPRHAAKRKPLAPRKQAPLFWESLGHGIRAAKAKPLVDTLGRVWPSARVAQALLPRARQMHIQASANGRGGAAGCLWRYLTAEELARIPPLHRAGQVVDWAAWGSVTTVRCDACMATTIRDIDAVRHDECVPHPPGFPTHPPLESHAGGPSHITGQFSDPQALKAKVLAAATKPRRPAVPKPLPPPPRPQPDFDPYDYEPHYTVPDTVPLSVPK